ncbi:prepilin peptidase [Vibrio sp. V27_P1S3P104]|nr:MULTISPECIES: A24 family peptidase [unclassified Vibrio]NAW69021.1 prepilin peptidase [Vibrio sp. V28_P6S34P95]NAX04276.1 prepilin peptidase [Vibrio sp. V30_P3S12P165]NAX33573.1 prepilin peptidase [Vibrio sp. V29_P1S30P107]NAX36106.1 prepilin peptidase [Vibrio sp. V27_P1S3P104]
MDIFYFYPWLFPIFATLFGLIIGSFLNVVIYRLPQIMDREWRKECADAFPEYGITPPEGTLTLSTPRSTCPHCQTQLKIRDNIPLLSWLRLKGKCAHCQAPISPRYPFVELLSALSSFVVAIHFGFSGYSLALLFFTYVLIAATFIDFDCMLLPDQLTLPLMWSGIGLALLGISPLSLTDAVLGTMLGYLSLWSIYWLFKGLTGKEGMGYGDFKLFAALGAWFGWQLLPLIILLSSFVGLIFGIVQLRLQKRGIDKAFPFGPYLAMAGWFAMLWGNQLITWYLHSLIG